MTRFRAIILDLDGTLCDTRVDLANAVNHARARFGLGPMTVAEVAACVGDGARRLMERAFADRPECVTPALASFADHYRRHLADHSPPYPGVAEGLAGLADEGAPMAVLTNKPQAMAKALLDHHGLARFLRFIHGGDSFPAHKPDPVGALAIMAALGVKPAETLMAGDNHTDLMTARAAGTASVFCEYGFGRQGDAPCDFRAAAFSDVVRIFRSDR
jgi:phosphoglycolate phosphatase